MNDYTVKETQKIFERYSNEYNIPIIGKSKNRISEDIYEYLRQILKGLPDSYKKFNAMKIFTPVRNYLNFIDKQMENEFIHLIFYRISIKKIKPIILINPDVFNYWQENYSSNNYNNYSDEKFIEAVETLLKQEIGHYLRYKEIDKNHEFIENNRCKAPFNERDYLNNELELDASELGEVNKDKLIYYNNILNDCRTEMINK